MSVPQDDAIEPVPVAAEQKVDELPTVAEETVEDKTVGGDAPVERGEPTDQELATLRRVSETIPLRAWYSAYVRS
jgi:hypothetical protein